MIDKHSKLLIVVFGIISLGLCLYPTNHAKAVSLTPTRFEIRGNPGETLTEEILVTNETSATETLYPSFSNFQAQGESGSPAFVEPQNDLGTWMVTGEPFLKLSPGQQKVVPFTVNIPKNAEPGGHFAVIFWGNSPTGSNNGVSVGAKTGVLVLLSVNGDVKEEAGLLNFNTIDKQFFYNTLPVSFEYRFKNDGGDRIKPTGEITIRDTVFFPAEYLDANPAEGNVLPNSTRKIKVDWVKYERPSDYTVPNNIFKKFFSDAYFEWKNFAVGLYSANLNVAYGAQDAHVKKTVFFFVFPWQLLIVLFLIFIIIFLGGKMLIKRYNRFIIEKAGGNTIAGGGLPPRV